MVSIRRRNAIDSLAIAAIGFYQRHISPRKGFACAYRVLHNSDSCSQYVKGAIARHGLVEALSFSQQRFADCKAANQILQAEAERKQEKDSRRSHPQKHNICCGTCQDAIDDSCDILSCADGCSSLGDCIPLDSLPNAGCCDAGCCDVGGCDAEGCDVGCCNVGSCS